MKRYTLHETFVVHQNYFDQWEEKTHHHDYFEIVFVEKGIGYYVINDEKIRYSSGSIFIVAPGDTHHFVVNKPSNFTHFKFTELLFSSKTNLPDKIYWLQQIEQLLHHPSLEPGDIIQSENDRKKIWKILDLILSEFDQEKDFYKEIVANSVSSILSIICRNISEIRKESEIPVLSKASKLDEILIYIRQNVYNNDLTKISRLASKFNMSQSSISTYFKKSTGESIHQYITKYKMKLAEERLKNSEFTVAEIANQLGYTDESHLTKTFKKYYNQSPKQYRETLVS